MLRVFGQLKEVNDSLSVVWTSRQVHQYSPALSAMTNILDAALVSNTYQIIANQAQAF